MKKNIKFLIVALVISVALTGCFKQEDKKSTSDVSNRNIVCSLNQNNTGFVLTQDMTIKIENKAMTSVNLYQKIVYDDSVTLTDALLDNLKVQMENAFKEQFNNVEVTKTSKGVDVNIDMTPEEMFNYSGTDFSETDIKNLTQKDINDLISEMEESGYTCK